MIAIFFLVFLNLEQQFPAPSHIPDYLFIYLFIWIKLNLDFFKRADIRKRRCD